MRSLISSFLLSGYNRYGHEDGRKAVRAVALRLGSSATAPDHLGGAFDAIGAAGRRQVDAVVPAPSSSSAGGPPSSETFYDCLYEALFVGSELRFPGGLGGPDAPFHVHVPSAMQLAAPYVAMSPMSAPYSPLSGIPSAFHGISPVLDPFDQAGMSLLAATASRGGRTSSRTTTSSTTPTGSTTARTAVQPGGAVNPGTPPPWVRDLSGSGIMPPEGASSLSEFLWSLIGGGDVEQDGSTSSSLDVENPVLSDCCTRRERQQLHESKQAGEEEQSPCYVMTRDGVHMARNSECPICLDEKGCTKKGVPMLSSCCVLADYSRKKCPTETGDDEESTLSSRSGQLEKSSRSGASSSSSMRGGTTTPAASEDALSSTSLSTASTAASTTASAFSSPPSSGATLTAKKESVAPKCWVFRCGHMTCANCYRSCLDPRTAKTQASIPAWDSPEYQSYLAQEVLDVLHAQNRLLFWNEVTTTFEVRCPLCRSEQGVAHPAEDLDEDAFVCLEYYPREALAEAETRGSTEDGVALGQRRAREVQQRHSLQLARILREALQRQSELEANDVASEAAGRRTTEDATPRSVSSAGNGRGVGAGVSAPEEEAEGEARRLCPPNCRVCTSTEGCTPGLRRLMGLL